MNLKNSTFETPFGYTDSNHAPTDLTKVDVICVQGENITYCNNFVIYNKERYWDSVGNIIDDVVAWKRRY